MKKLDKAGKVLNIVLGIVYIPLSFISWLLPMVSESIIGATNPIFITLVEILCAISFAIPFLSVAGIVVSVILRIKGRSVVSFVVQFLPLVLFVLNLILLCYADTIPEML